MVKDDTFDRRFWRLMLIFGAILIVIGFLPILFTQWAILDFTQTGPIGDTIGGIMGPFVSIVGAILTFIAFWIQYKANERQFDIITRQQEKENVENIEKRLFFLIEHYFRMEEQCHHSGYRGKGAFGVCLKEIQYLVNMVHLTVAKNYVLNEHFLQLNDCHKYAIIKIATELWWDGYDRNISNRGYLLRILNDFDRLTGIGNPMRERYTSIRHDSDQATIFNELHDYQYKSLHNNSRLISGIEIHNIGLSRSNQFSGYFKSVYNILVFVNEADPKILSYRKKSELVKFFIGLLSDEELELLSYISLSKVLNGIEIQGKDMYWGLIQKHEELKAKEWINRMIISKYEIFDTLFRRSTNPHPFEMVFCNHTSGSQIETKIFDYAYFQKVWYG